MNHQKKNKVKVQKPVERHQTASWTDAHKSKPVTKVRVPDEAGVIDSKEYVDHNQK